MVEHSRPQILLTDGRIYRDAWDTEPASAMLVEGNRIAWIGEISEAPIADNTLRLNGKSVLPGLTDAHIHILAVAQARLQISAADPSIHSMADFLNQLADAAQGGPPSQWVMGSDVNEQAWPELRLPDRFDLDVILPSRPVALRRFCGHVVILNTAAMKLLEEGLDLHAAGMDRDSRGLTGIAREAAADAIFQHLPRPSNIELSRMAREVMADLARSGITAATEAAVGFSFGFEAEWSLWHGLQSGGSIPLRLGFMLQIDPDDARYLTPGPRTDPWWQMRTLKLFADGIIGARTAALGGGFADGAPSGSLMHPVSHIEAFIEAADAAGWQIGAHAIGDDAIDLVANLYSKCHGANHDPRHRIEHLGVPRPEALPLLFRAGAVVVTQPSFIIRMGDSWQHALGRRRDHAFPARSVIQAGVILAGSSDAPTGSLCPWEGISAFTNRRTTSGAVVAPAERLTLREAVHAYTVGGAHAMHQETWRGKLAPGHSADFAVFEVDPFCTDADELPGLKSTLTVAGGRPTHDPLGLWKWSNERRQ